MSANDHGSASTYINHHCRCDQCKAAHSAYIASARARRKSKGLAADDPRHGKYTTYQNYACRCDRCRIAHTEALRQRAT